LFQASLQHWIKIYRKPYLTFHTLNYIILFYPTFFDFQKRLLTILKHIHVTCAIIEHNGLVLAAQRSATMSLPLKWEFPGGKIEPGETAEGCLKRELAEELDADADIGINLPQSTHTYPTFTITLYPFVCSINSSKLVLKEHHAIKWLLPIELGLLDWAEADLPVLESYLGYLRG